MMFLTLTTAQLLAYLTTVCPSKVIVLPESNTTIVYKCMSNPELLPPKYPDIRTAPSVDDISKAVEGKTDE